MPMLAGTPVPERATVCGLPAALSVTVLVPGWLPTAVGVKVTLMMQLLPTAREAPQKPDYSWVSPRLTRKKSAAACKI